MSTIGWFDPSWAAPCEVCGNRLGDHWRGRPCLQDVATSAYPWVPVGGAHPDTWRAFSPQVPRLYVVGRVAIIAPDPDSAWRMWMSTKGKQMTHMQELLDYCKGQCNRLLYGQPCTSRRCLHRAGYEHNPQVENGTCEAFEIFVILDSIKDR